MISHWMLSPEREAQVGPWKWFSVVPSNQRMLSPSFTVAREALTLESTSLTVNIQPSGSFTSRPLMVWMKRPKVEVVE